MDRLIIAHTPLPSHQLLFRSLSGEEKLAGLFEFDVELLSPDNRLDLKALLGQKRAGVKPFVKITRRLKPYMGQQVSAFSGRFAEVLLRGPGVT
ncbi:hypothetical protein [Serratia marcescens]|uniref:hypothetical protein n=1 Tax=Serratia marcescens TaxID=615 RepID=UPI001644C697|nr:hypothetical protein [Serratia marcescens]